MAERGAPPTQQLSASITVHDPCGNRFKKEVHQAVRKLAAAKFLHINEMQHHGKKTICCGEGGSVGCLLPELAKATSPR
jgi:Fe-S oxidoreductase